MGRAHTAPPIYFRTKGDRFGRAIRRRAPCRPALAHGAAMARLRHMADAQIDIEIVAFVLDLGVLDG